MTTHFPDIDFFRKDISFADNINHTPLNFITTWGLFSPKSVDEGSRLLLDNMKVLPTDNCLDVGCGYGPLGIYAAKHTSGKVTMIDKDFVAIEYCQKNVLQNKLKNCDVYLSNGFNQVKDKNFSLIFSNLPAKVGNEMLSLYFVDAYQHLSKGGRFYVVTITGMRKFVQRSFNEIFGNYDKVKQGKNYTVAMATNLTS